MEKEREKLVQSPFLTNEETEVNRPQLISYLNSNLAGLSKSYIELYQNCLSGVYFLVCSLDILGALDQALFTKAQLIEWVYEFQVPVFPGDSAHVHCYGFRGGKHLPFTSAVATELLPNDMSHLANTYCALCILKMCGDDLSRVHKKEIVQSLKHFQSPTTGQFQCLPREVGEAENDVRFLYCACCISQILDDWSGIDQERAVEHLISLQDYAGGFGWEKNAESHSGLTYCIVAALKMLNALDRIPSRDVLVDYLISRAAIGWNGRIGKDPDTCYSYWNIATLVNLGINTRVN